MNKHYLKVHVHPFVAVSADNGAIGPPRGAIDNGFETVRFYGRRLANANEQSNIKLKSVTPTVETAIWALLLIRHPDFVESSLFIRKLVPGVINT